MKLDETGANDVHDHHGRIYLDSAILARAWHWWLKNLNPAFDPNLFFYRRLLSTTYDNMGRDHALATNFEIWLAENGGEMIEPGRYSQLRSQLRSIAMTPADATVFLLRLP